MKKLLFFFALISLTNVANAQTGPLDTTFNSDGVVITSFNNFADGINALALQTDGKIVAAGYSYVSTALNDDYFSIARYNPNGSLDITFGNGGEVTTDVNQGQQQIRSVAVQTDGKIVVCGFSSNGMDLDFALARYNTDGTLDTSFGSGGKVITEIYIRNDYAYSLVIQPDGKIIAAGYTERMTAGYFDFAVARYNTDGSLDATFGSGGIVMTPIGTISSEGFSAALQSNGKILVAGYTYNGTQQDMAMVRYNTDGSLDTGFGNSGIVITPISTGDDVANSVALQSDGKIILAGYATFGNYTDIALARYTTNGSLDSTFNNDGIVTTNICNYDGACSVKQQADSKILIAGYTNIPSTNNYCFALVRYNSNGNLDSSYNTNGIVTTPAISGNANAMVIQPDGKIVLGGNGSNSVTGGYAIERFLSEFNTGVVEFSNADNPVLVYPNPVKNYITIKSLQQSTIEILNIQGQTILQRAIPQGKTNIDMSKLAKGAYILRLYCNDKTAVTRIVKE